jgi:integrase
LEGRTVTARAPRTPSYRHHKPSDQAVVTLNGRDVYLGVYGTAASRAEYDRVIAEWLAAGRRPPAGAGGQGGGLPGPTVNELIVAYVGWADGYYRKGDRPTSEPKNIRGSLGPLHHLYGPTAAGDFGPLALKAVREEMIRADLCRNEINKRVGRIVRMFKWGVENEHVPPAVYQALKAVAGLRKRRSEARESPPVKPVPEAHVEAVRPFVSRQVWAMVELQRLTGMRPGEVCQMRTVDLDTSGRVWVYTPESHKTEHHGKERPIYLGPRAQEVVKPWLRTDLAAYLFSPAEAMEEFWAARRRARVTPLTPSQRARKKRRKPKRRPGDRYAVTSYDHAIRDACQRAAVPHWHAHQLRHSAATWLRKEFGLDLARIILGHSSPATAALYAEADRAKAVAAMLEVG